VQKAKALLATDSGEHGPGNTDEEASAISGLTTRSLERLRARTFETGPLGALERKPRETPPGSSKVTGEIEARIVQIACSEAPEGRSRWTLKMIAERLVELEIVDSIAKETVRVTLKKRTQALAAAVLVYPAGKRRRVRSRDGGRVRNLCPGTRPETPAGLPR
jgi:hypothetical protein